jgi:hypothetical protein
VVKVGGVGRGEVGGGMWKVEGGRQRANKGRFESVGGAGTCPEALGGSPAAWFELKMDLGTLYRFLRRPNYLTNIALRRG